MMMNGFISLYGLCLALGALLCWRVMRVSARHWGLRRGTRTVLFALTAVFAVLLARVHYIVLSPYGRMGLGFVSMQPYEYAMCGAVLGGLLAGLLAALVTRQSIGFVLDALAPVGLLMIAIARAGEVFADFGWGNVIEGEMARFPLAVPDMFGQWHWAVFFLEAVFALLVLAFVMIRKQNRTAPGEVFSLALLWWAMSQVFCESLRAESIKLGFVRVQQVECALFALGVLLCFARRKGLTKKQLGVRLGIFALCIGVLVFVEFALDKLTEMIPIPVSYGVMAAALIAMGVMVQLTVCRKKKA